MSRPLTHPLHQETLRTAQRLLRARVTWLEWRQKINNLRTRERPQVIKYGSTAKDDQLRQAMDRLYEVRESAPA